MQRTAKKRKGFYLAHDQYQQLKQRLAMTKDVREKYVLFRRLTNLLEVMEFLNLNPGRPH